MTTAVSTNNKAGRYSPALHNFKENVRSNSKLLIMFGVLHLFAAPMVMLALIISVYTGNDLDNIDVYLVIGVLTTALAGFMGIFPAVNSFSELNDKTVVDMRFSLPLNATQRFVSNFLSGLFVYIVPFLGAQVLSLLLGCYGLLFMDGKTFDYVTDIDVKRYDVYTCEYFSQAVPMLLKLIFAGLLCMLMLYTLTVLITVCCGSKFESIAYTILVNVAIPVTILCVFYSMLDNLYGINAEEPIIKLISYTSVAGGILTAVNWIMTGDIFDYSFNYGIWALVFFLLTAAYGVLAYFLYKKRRAPQTSRPFAFKLAYYIVVTCIEFCIISVMHFRDNLVPCIIVTAIVYMIFEVVTNRGFKKIWQSGIKYVCTFIAAAGIIVLSEVTDGFGTVWRVPSAGSVKSVEIAYDGYYGFFTIDETVTLTDPENIQTIIDMHGKILDSYRENHTDREDWDYYYNFCTIRYNLRGGGSFERQYYCDSDPAITELLAKIDLTEEYKSRTAEQYKEKISDAYEELLRNESQWAAYPNDAPVITMVNRGRGTTSVQYGAAAGVPVSRLLHRDFFPQLAEAYSKDIMAITDENYYRSEYHNIWQLQVAYPLGGSGYLCLDVPESFSNTVELLEYFGIEMNRIEDMTAEELMRADTSTGSQLHLFRTGEVREMFGIPSELPVHGYVMRYYWDTDRTSQTYVYGTGEDVLEIVRSVQPMNIADDNGYIIHVYNCSGAVPADLTGIADSIARTGYNEELVQLYTETVYGESTDSSEYYD